MDWQEAVVALIGAGAVARLLFVVRRRRSGKGGGCSSCSIDCPYRRGRDRKKGEH